jgi:hypothetical protein
VCTHREGEALFAVLGSEDLWMGTGLEPLYFWLGPYRWGPYRDLGAAGTQSA